MFFRQTVYLLLSVVMFMGCQTNTGPNSPNVISSGMSVSPVVTSNKKNLPENTGQLVVYRDGTMGLARSPSIMIDAVPHGFCQYGHYTTIELRPGSYRLAVGAESVDVEIADGEQTFAKCGVVRPWRLTDPTSGFVDVIKPEAAEKEASKLSLLMSYKINGRPNSAGNSGFASNTVRLSAPTNSSDPEIEIIADLLPEGARDEFLENFHLFQWSKDDFENRYILSSKQIINTFDVSLFVSKESAVGAAKITYHNDSWLFVSKVRFNSDGDVYSINDIDRKQFSRDNTSGSIWEWVRFTITDDVAKRLRQIAQSERTQIRFTGRDFYDDRDVSEQEKLYLLTALKILGY